MSIHMSGGNCSERSGSLNPTSGTTVNSLASLRI